MKKSHCKIAKDITSAIEFDWIPSDIWKMTA